MWSVNITLSICASVKNREKIMTIFDKDVLFFIGEGGEGGGDRAKGKGSWINYFLKCIGPCIGCTL